MSPHVRMVNGLHVVDVLSAADVPSAESAHYPADAFVRASLPEECGVVLRFCTCLLTGM